MISFDKQIFLVWWHLPHYLKNFITMASSDLSMMLLTMPESLRHFLMSSSKCFIVEAFTFWSIIHCLSPFLPNFIRCINSIIPEDITFAYYFPTHVSEFMLVLFLTVVMFTTSSFASVSQSSHGWWSLPPVGPRWVCGGPAFSESWA